jgi:hypothetical protein
MAASAAALSFGLWAGCASPASAGPPADSLPPARSGGKYLDCHVHIAGLGARGSGCFVSPALRGSYKFPVFLKAFGVTEKELREQGDGIVADRIAAGIADSKTVGGAVILALDGVADARGGLDTARTQIYLPNDFVAAEARKPP